MIHDPPGEPRRYGGWRLNLVAMALVVATLLIGYGLAHPRDLPLPFGVDSVARADPERR